MKLLTFLFVLLLSFSAFAQKAVLNNESIIDLVKAGVSDVIIIAKIKSSGANYDTSTDALIRLKKNNVSDNVQAAMFEQAGAVENKAAEITTDAPENGKLSEITDKTRVYLSSSDLKARETMEKELQKYPRLQSVDTPENADFSLVYEITDKYINGSFIGDVGELVAVARGSQNGQGKTRIRIFYTTRIEQQTAFDLNPAKSTMRRFITAFKKARNE